MENLYRESPTEGNSFRDIYLKQVQGVIAARRAASIQARRLFLRIDSSSVEAYVQSLQPLRAKFRAMLGFPLVDSPEVPPVPEVGEWFVARDDLGEIHRLQIEAFEGYAIYGLLFIPPGPAPHRLVISQHGGQGTPELTADFFGSANYNDMTRRLLRRGFAVFAPQLLLWRNEFGPAFEVAKDRNEYDRQLKHLGGSITALELFGLQRSLDYLLGRPDIRPDGAGICGLSYGGFYALFAAANDPRLVATISSCFVNDRLHHNWPDWVWGNAGNTFLDAEVAALICPRALYIEVGEHDAHFDADRARPVLEQIGGYYAALGLNDRFVGRVFDGGHEFATTDESIDFLVKHLEAGLW